MGDVPEEKNASGDAEDQKPEQVPEVPTPPKIPDVELIVDGFGFMPKSMRKERRNSNFFTKGKAAPKEEEKTEEEQSPCASSTNIDIVRRYTWKTKNRMSVQVHN